MQSAPPPQPDKNFHCTGQLDHARRSRGSSPSHFELVVGFAELARGVFKHAFRSGLADAVDEGGRPGAHGKVEQRPASKADTIA